MPAILDLVRPFARLHGLFFPGIRVVAAVSGGSDSVALAHILRDLERAGELTLVSVAHLNHQLRATSGRDEQAAIALAERLCVPVFVERADVRGRMAGEQRSLEDAAHAERYEFFERARRHAGADSVAVGHTRDDQAETFLLRLMRGAGARGLASMYPRHGTIVRPVLGCHRSDLRAYLQNRGLTWVEDESNADVAIARNRVRAELLPLLRDRFNPAIVDVLADEAALARETWDWVEQETDGLYARAVSVETGPVETRMLEVSALMAAPAVLRRAVVWRAMREVAGGRPVAFAHVDAALRLVAGDEDTELAAPGQRVERQGSRLVLRGRPVGAVGRVTGATVNLFHYSLSIPGEVRLPEAGCVVSAEPMAATASVPETATETGAMGGTETVAYVRRDLCRSPLGVRNRRPGDRFRPAGLGGKKKLQDFFVDLKVARDTRDRVPLVVDDLDRIVWVAGHGIDEGFRVTDCAQGVLVLRLRRV